jgi:O-antigen/teichoic acid export membrane protein
MARRGCYPRKIARHRRGDRCRRSIDFRRLQIIQLTALLGSQLLLALPLALLGCGIWSLVAAGVANSLATSAAAYAITRHEIGLAFSREAWKLGRLSLWYLLLNIVNAILGTLPQIVIGRLFGAGVLGLFDRAYSLIVTPVDRAAETVSGVLFSFFSRTNQHGAMQHDVFLSCLTIAVFFGLPCTAVMMVHSELVIASTLGAKWAAAAPLVTPFSVFIPLLLLLQVAVPILNGRGRPEIEIVIVVLMVALFSLMVTFAHRDVEDVVWSLLAAYGFRVGCLLLSAQYLIGVGWRPMLVATLPGLAATALLLLGNLLLAAVLPPDLPSALRLAAVALGSGAALLSLWASYRGYLPNAHIRRALAATAAKP